MKLKSCPLHILLPTLYKYCELIKSEMIFQHFTLKSSAALMIPEKREYQMQSTNIALALKTESIILVILHHSARTVHLNFFTFL